MLRYAPQPSHQVWLTEEGTVKLVKGGLRFAQSKGLRDFMFFTASEPPHSSEGQFELASGVLEFAEHLSVGRLITRGRLTTDRVTDTPKSLRRQHRIGTHEVEKHGALKLTGGSINGTNGLLLGLAKPRNIDAYYLLEEVPGCLSLDPNAARAVLRVVYRMTGIDVDMSRLEKQAKENREAIERTKDAGKKWGKTEIRRSTFDRELSYVT